MIRYDADAAAVESREPGHDVLREMFVHFEELARLEQLTASKLRSQASFRDNQGPQVSFDRPDLSPCLKTIADRSSPAFREAVELVARGQQRLAARPEADRPEFVACEMDQWRENAYQARRQTEARNRAAIREGKTVYDR